jgi:hypothetical protein
VALASLRESLEELSLGISLTHGCSSAATRTTERSLTAEMDGDAPRPLQRGWLAATIFERHAKLLDFASNHKRIVRQVEECTDFFHALETAAPQNVEPD